MLCSCVCVCICVRTRAGLYENVRTRIQARVSFLYFYPHPIPTAVRQVHEGVMYTGSEDNTARAWNVTRPQKSSSTDSSSGIVPAGAHAGDDVDTKKVDADGVEVAYLGTMVLFQGHDNTVRAAQNSGVR